jgi:hypothetical protein
MDQEKLLRLADFLEILPDERFNLKRWSQDHFEPTACETTACACGWASVIFPELALKPVKFNTGRKSIYFTDKDNIEYFGWIAIEKFFDLTQEEANDLFFVDSYRECNIEPSRKNVIKRIREFVVAKATE